MRRLPQHLHRSIRTLSDLVPQTSPATKSARPGQCCLKSVKEPLFLPRICSRALMGCVARRPPSVTSRCRSLRLPVSADAHSSRDVIAFEGRLTRTPPQNQTSSSSATACPSATLQWLPPSWPTLRSSNIRRGVAMAVQKRRSTARGALTILSEHRTVLRSRRPV